MAALDTLQSLTALNVDNATVALEQGLDAIRSGQTVFDLRNVQAVDSVAVSVMLSWQRAAHDAGTPLKLKNLPPNLKSLTKLYGVCELLSSVQPPVPADPALTATPADLQHH
jgi:phospholipid transport system transporter-binding protein